MKDKNYQKINYYALLLITISDHRDVTDRPSFDRPHPHHQMVVAVATPDSVLTLAVAAVAVTLTHHHTTLLLPPQPAQLEVMLD